MKILFYCQHVLGIGHFFRSLELCRAFAPDEVVLVTGGKSIQIDLPPNVREVQLPELMMDQDFKNLHAGEKGPGLEKVKEDRKKIFRKIYLEEKPDVFLMELYPMGRKAFRFELDPILDGIRRGDLPSSFVLSSVRDILVEKENQEKHERRALEHLNRFFDGLLVHADPRVIKLNATFGYVDEIQIPVVYTGFVAPKPGIDARQKMREQLGLKDAEQLIVASAGGGKVGERLLKAVIQAVGLLPQDDKISCCVFAGPFMDADTIREMEAAADKRTRIERFSTDFLSHLSAADLSISMAGYNTCMNILTTGVPALVWPFAQNREQGLRAEQLEKKHALEVLGDQDLSPERLAGRIEKMFGKKRSRPSTIDLEGATFTCAWVKEHMSTNV